MTEAVTGRRLALHSEPGSQRALLLTPLYRAEPYHDRPPSRDYRRRDPSFREPLPREAPIREVSPRDAPPRDMLPPAPVPVAPAAPTLPMQPASTIVVPPPEPQIDREKVRGFGQSIQPVHMWLMPVCTCCRSAHCFLGFLQRYAGRYLTRTLVTSLCSI